MYWNLLKSKANANVNSLIILGGGVKVHKNTVLIEIECENGVEKIFCMVEGSII